MKGLQNRLMCSNCKHCIKKSSLFSLLDNDELECLNGERTEASFKAGEIIYKQGTPLTHLVIIHEGFGKIYIEEENGRNLILSYTKLLEVNGGIGLFMDKRHHSSLKAVTDCEACFIDVNSFLTVFRGNQNFMDAFLNEFALRMHHTYRQFAILTQKNMVGRMADSIIYLMEELFNNGSIDHIPKKDLAELTAMTTESAIRVLKEFKDEGLIKLNGKSIKILNKKALEQIALRG
jgi:CRP/FNR family transcriptional regulator, polysaccharide utilization system transcription regulator